MSLLKTLSINTAANYGLQVVKVVLNLAVIPVLVQAVGADGYGLIVLANAVIGYFVALELGVTKATIKYVAEFVQKDDYEEVSRIVNTSLWFFIGIGLLVALLVVLFVQLGGIAVFRISPSLQVVADDLFYIAACFSVLAWPARIFEGTLRGLQRYAACNTAHAVGAIASPVVAIVAALNGASLVTIFFLMNVAVALKWVLQWALVRRYLTTWRITTRGNWQTLKMMFGFGFWVMLSQLAALLLYKTDRIILAIFLPVSSLTIYEVVTIPFRYIKMFSSQFNAAMIPAVSAEFARGGRKALDKFIYVASRYNNLFVSAIAITGVLLAEPFIRVWMGSEYAAYAWIAQVACLFQLLYQSNSALGTVFSGSARLKEIALIAIFIAILNIPLGIWWVQEIGIAGVVFSTIAAGIIGIVLQYIFAFPVLQINRLKYFVEAVFKAQWISWIVGSIGFFVLYPAVVGFINSWFELVGLGALLTALCYSAAWFVIVRKRDRQRVLHLLARK